MWFWFGLTAIALIGEVLTTTFYLLLVALGFAAGGTAAWLGAPVWGQLIACALMCLVGLLVLRKTGVLKKREVNAARNADVNLDIGQAVMVDGWSPQGVARVRYRGASWEAEAERDAPREAGPHVIVAVRGTRLILKPRPD